MSTPHIVVFYGSNRPNPAAPKVAKWLESVLASEIRATFSFVNLVELNLPIFDQAGALLPEGPFPSEIVKNWSETVANADGFIAITNEYNHGPSAIVKNAIDYLNKQWNHKPIAFLSYGGVGGGLRAVENLRQVFAELYAMTVRHQLSVHHVYSQYDENGLLKTESVQGDLPKLVDELLWWTNALKTARAQ